jgi:hypothetical protein
LSWWDNAVIYQIYPRSFQDSDGDGIGDLRGIEKRLDHLAWLGVDAIWLSPIYPSPMHDFGYDVADYTGIDPLFGSLDDFDSLVDAARARSIQSSPTSTGATPRSSRRCRRSSGSGWTVTSRATASTRSTGC